jgi:hypothetical protein
MRTGDTARRSRTVTARDIELFTQMTGDRNPLHYDEDLAARSRFEHHEDVEHLRLHRQGLAPDPQLHLVEIELALAEQEHHRPAPSPANAHPQLRRSSPPARPPTGPRRQEMTRWTWRHFSALPARWCS